MAERNAVLDRRAYHYASIEGSNGWIVEASARIGDIKGSNI